MKSVAAKQVGTLMYFIQPIFLNPAKKWFENYPVKTTNAMPISIKKPLNHRFKGFLFLIQPWLSKENKIYSVTLYSIYILAQMTC
jgi:hypothetical protein